MEYIPAQAPPSDHHPFNTGLSTENGVTPKQFIEHVNANFKHVFEVLKGEVAHAVDVVDSEARSHLADLAEHVTALEQRFDKLIHLFEGAMTAAPTPQLPPALPPTSSTAGGLDDVLKQAAG